MFFGGNKNINNKLGAFIIAFVFVIGLFSFGEVNAQETSAQEIKTLLNYCSNNNGRYDPDKFGNGGCTLDEDSYDKLSKEYESRTTLSENQQIINTSSGLIAGYESQIKAHGLSIGKCLNGGDCRVSVSTLEAEIKSLEKKKVVEQKKIKNAQEKVSDSEAKIKDLNSCGSLLFDTSCHIKKAFTSYLATTSNIILEFVGLILRAAGLALDETVNFTILGMSEFLNGPNGESVKISWSIFRDIINMLFIFGLLFISISTIIKGIGPKTKTALVSIIASALLINFSYFFTAVLIDTSNFLSTEVYSSIENTKGCTTDFSKGISGCLISKIKLTTVFNPLAPGGSIANDINGSSVNLDTSSVGNAIGGDSGFIGAGETYIKTFIAVILGSVFIIIASFVLLALALMLIIRFIMLILLLITSPVMFLGWVLPNFSNLSKKWFNSLNEQLLFPPLVFLFIFITLSIADGISLIAPTVFGTVINYLLIMGFMVASIMIAKKVGATGASFATKYAGNLAIGSTAKLGRTTVGRFASRAAQNVEGNGAWAKAKRSTFKTIGNSTFDGRRAPGFKGVATATGINFGEGRKDGFTKLNEASIKKSQAAYKEVGNATYDESADIDKTRQIILAKYSDNAGKIKDAKDVIKSTKESMGGMKKGSEDYEKGEKVILEQKQVIIENSKIIKDSEEMKKIKSIEGQGKDRQKKELQRMTATWVNPSERGAAAKIREDNAKKEKEEDFDKLLKEITKSKEKEDKKDDK